MPGPQGVPRAEIIALLREGHSDRYIARTLRTATKRVAKIRAEFDLPRVEPVGLSLEQRWATFTQPAAGGHLAWTGYLREGTCPVLKYRGEDYTARRVAFLIGRQREPEGRVLAGCDWPPCVAPQHVEDARMRNQYTAIFGGTP
jgi:hypothetical protein